MKPKSILTLRIWDNYKINGKLQQKKKVQKWKITIRNKQEHRANLINNNNNNEHEGIRESLGENEVTPHAGKS